MSRLALSLALFLGCAALGAQLRPLRSPTPSAAGLSLQADPVAIRACAQRQAWSWPGLALPGGIQVDLQLTRLAHPLQAGALHVDGRAAARGMDPSLSLWRGTISGWKDSEVFLALSAQGCRAWLGRPGRWFHLLCGPGPGRDWSRPVHWLVDQRGLAAGGFVPQLRCAAQRLAARAQSRKQRMSALPANRPLLLDVPIAFETDDEYFQVFNSLPAAESYTIALLGAVAMRYREQLNVVLTVPYLGFHTQGQDPWRANQCYNRLSEFRLAWGSGKAPKPAALYHMLTGGSKLGCGGLAYLDVLCDQQNGFGISGNIFAQMTFPPVQGPLTWDFFVIAHELGHNFGSKHTQDYTPPLDGCVRGNCTNQGTIMSYCHTCNGGMNNITLRFHPTVVARIKASIARSCLQPFEGVLSEDLGQGLAGPAGIPAQHIGYRRPAVEVALSAAPVRQAGICVLSTTRANLPLAGGVLVPRPDVLLGLASDASGKALLRLPVSRSYPRGIRAYVQTWFNNPGASSPLAATAAHRVELIKP